MSDYIAYESEDRIMELEAALEKYANAIERDRYEPDKIICSALSMRRIVQKGDAWVVSKPIHPNLSQSKQYNSPMRTGKRCLSGWAIQAVDTVLITGYTSMSRDNLKMIQQRSGK